MPLSFHPVDVRYSRIANALKVLPRVADALQLLKLVHVDIPKGVADKESVGIVTASGSSYMARRFLSSSGAYACAENGLGLRIHRRPSIRAANLVPESPLIIVADSRRVRKLRS